MAWKQTLVTLGVAVLAALFVRTSILTAYKVPTGSMQPALKPGDYIFASRIHYGWRIPGTSNRMGDTVPERGDLVIFSYPQQPSVIYIKRVIARPGDRLQIVDNRLILNGSPLIYRPVGDDGGDNPSPDLFEIREEIAPEGRWRVIVQKSGGQKNFGPFVVPPGEVFLLGDNRDTSDDSRYWGAVPISQIEGKAVLIWLSLDWQNRWGGGRYPSLRWPRIFSLPH